MEMKTINLHNPTVFFGNEIYTINDNDQYTTLKTEKNSDGFKVTLNFSKDTEKHERSMEAIKEFYVREILS